jgi:hypothetical protein
MAFFALVVFMYALVLTMVGWDKAYKAMLAGGKVLPVVAWMSSFVFTYVGGVLVISALL